MSVRYALTEPRDAAYHYWQRSLCRIFGRHGRVCAGRPDHRPAHPEGSTMPLEGVRLLTLDRTCDACPSQWNACDDSGMRYYIRYRWGWLMVRLGGVEGPDIFVRRLGDPFDGEMTDAEMLAATGMEMA